MSIEVRRASPEEIERAMELRIAVFVGEQGVDEAEETDDLDGQATHLVALDDGAVVGTCRLLGPDADTVRLGRMVVAREHRGEGIGRALLEEGERWARARGARRIALHAQTRARTFYARGGYRAVSGPFMEAGIEHVSMELDLA